MELSWFSASVNVCHKKSLKNDRLTLNFHWESPWCWERLRAEGEKGVRGWDGWSITDAMTMNLGKLREMVRDKEAWRGAVHGVTKSGTRLGTEQPQPWILWSRNHRLCLCGVNTHNAHTHIIQYLTQHSVTKVKRQRQFFEESDLDIKIITYAVSKGHCYRCSRI